MTQSYETDQTVRFWTLAACYNVDASYLHKLADLALKDVAPEVAMLAASISDPSGRPVVSHFGLAVNQSQFDALWPILRVMRVMPFPMLAEQLCELLVRQTSRGHLAYDIFFALLNPPTLHAAGPFLRSRLGAGATVDLLFSILVEADPVATDYLAPLLLAFERAELVEVLSEYDKDATYRKLARRISSLLAKELNPSADMRLSVAGYTADTVANQADQLDIAREVQVLTAVMLAKDVVPPLAIGLFGDWGSGKSFFMKSMRASVDRLSESKVDVHRQRFCSNVVQIEFNAWHYADTNLWASLGSSILEKLNTHFKPAKTTAIAQDATAQELNTARQEVVKSQSDKDEIARSLLANEEALALLAKKRQVTATSLPELALSDIQKLLESDPELKETVEKALKSLGLPAAFRSVSDLQHALGDVQSTFNRFLSIVRALFTFKSLGIFLVLIGMISFLVPMLFDWLSRFLPLWQAEIGAKLTQFTTGAFALAAWLRQATGKVQAGLGKIDHVRQVVEGIVKSKVEKRSPEESALQQQIDDLKTRQRIADEKIISQQAQVRDLESALEQLAKEETLKYFLSERIKTDDYRKHLGLMGTVRSDFAELERRIDAQVKSDGETTVDRIVLYIDDLDRCPAAQVVQVLQAVHMLLAYRLFVVVVGVDSRWLMHSLTTHYRQLRGETGDTGDAEWTASPQHYLEKIFQIAFSLKPMNRQGYGKLIGQLMAGIDSSNDIPDLTESARPAPAIRKNSATPLDVIANADADVEPGVPDSVPPSPHAPETQELPREQEFVVEDAAMVIQGWEARFAENLYEFVRSPRAAKRLSNIYRILKAGLRRSELASFEGNDERSGDYRVPMLLLAILIYAPDAAETLFVSIVNCGDEEKGLDEITAESSIGEPLRAELAAKIIRIVVQDGFPNKLALFRVWAPRVARFSFGMAQLKSEP